MPHLLIVNAFTSVQGIPIHLPVFIFALIKRGWECRRNYVVLYFPTLLLVRRIINTRGLLCRSFPFELHHIWWKVCI